MKHLFKTFVTLLIVLVPLLSLARISLPDIGLPGPTTESGSTDTTELKPNMNLSTANGIFLGENEGNGAGKSVSSAGDVDGDGNDDIIIGAYSYNNSDGVQVGRTYIVLSSTIGSGINMGLADADIIFEGEGGYSGNSVAGIGDIDDDGLDDILIGDYSIGKAYLYFASSFVTRGSFDLSNADIIFEPSVDSTIQNFSSSAVNAGDVDGDDKNDILIGECGHSGSVPKFYLFLGSSLSSGTVSATDADKSFTGDSSDVYESDSLCYAWTNQTAATASDVDGDGLGDVLFSAYDNDEGRIYLFFGSTIATASTFSFSDANIIFVGESDSDQAGFAVSSAGDIDGDGLSDIIIGARWNDDNGPNAGKAYIFMGSTFTTGGTYYLADADIVLKGEAEIDLAGFSVSSAGDIDGDGLSDILVGARYNNDGGDNAGKSYLFLGKRLSTASAFNLSEADASFYGDSNDSLGNYVASAGDVNGDGKDDVVIGAMHSNEYAGGAYLWFGDEIEVCDGIDNDGDGEIDEGVLTTFYQDSDSDGYGDPNNSDQACNSSSSTVTNPVTDSSDCNDTLSSIYPSATEVCGDSVDQDCDSADTTCPEETETVTEEEPVTEETEEETTVTEEVDEQDSEVTEEPVVEEEVVQEEVVEEEVVEVEEEEEKIIEDEGTDIESTGDSNLTGGGCGCDFGASKKLNSNQVILMLLSAFPIMLMASIRRRIKNGYSF